MSIYEFFKDFAAPFATISAASAAVAVTFYLNKRQVDISATQRDIALDKLKFDAWEKRYEIYTQARTLLYYVAQQNDFEKIDSARIRTLRIKMDEARFFFGPTVRTFLDEVDKTSEDFLSNLSDRYAMHEADDEVWKSINEKLLNNTRKISALYADMPQQFEKSLRLSQLTRE